VAFWFVIVACAIAAIASWVAGSGRPAGESVGEELAATCAEAGTIPADLAGMSRADMGVTVGRPVSGG
jgi:hypothetical protein